MSADSVVPLLDLYESLTDLRLGRDIFFLLCGLGQSGQAKSLLESSRGVEVHR